MSSRQVIVYSREGCHICDRAIQILRELAKTRNFNLDVVDIRTDELLLKEYLIRIPVVRVDGVDLLEAEDLANPKDARGRLEAACNFKKS
jgi:glutaredoxin